MMKKHLGINISGINVLQPAGKTWSDLLHACQKGMAIDHIVSIAFIIGQAYADQPGNSAATAGLNEA